MATPSYLGAGTPDRTTAGSITLTPTLPPTSVAPVGSFLVAGYQAATTLTCTPPPGWTVLANAGIPAASVAGRVVYCVKVRAASEPDPVFTLSASSTAKASAFVVAYKDVASYVAGTPLNRATTIATTDCPSVTPGAAARLITLGSDKVTRDSVVGSADDTITVTGQTMRVTDTIGGGSGVSYYVGDEVVGATATGVRTINYSIASGAALGMNLALIGSSFTAPTVNAGADLTKPAGAAVSITATETPGSGTINARQWTQTQGPDVMAGATGKTTATLGFTPAAAGDYAFTYTVTDTNGLTGTDDVVVHVGGSTARPSSTISNPGAWSPVGAASTLYDALADTDDTTYVESPALPTGNACTLGMTALSAGTPVVAARLRQKPDSPTPQLNQTVKVKQGTTTIASRTVALTTSWVDYSWTLTGGESALVTRDAAGIPSPALSVELSANQA